MKLNKLWYAAFSILLLWLTGVHAETTGDDGKYTDSILSIAPVTGSFPSLGERTGTGEVYWSSGISAPQFSPAIWPFSGEEGSSTKTKPKSPRKAFFLSMLLPGLGETYVGSKRGLLFLGIEAFSWWTYVSNTNKGNDLDKDFRAFADTYWHYNDESDSHGDPLDHDYWRWLDYNYIKDNSIGPTDYDKIEAELEKNADISVHNLTGEKDQQYYEMIGKYPQFVYGWEDIVENNDTLRDENDKFNENYKEDIKTIVSPLRNHYENMRYDSNKKLKAGQTGIYIMIINRVLSAIDAGRLAYNHDKKLESELSMVQVRVVQKQILDHKVSMIILTKKY